MKSFFALLAILYAFTPALLEAQDTTGAASPVQTKSEFRAAVAVVPDTGNVGDAYRVAIRIQLPRGIVPSFPDTLDISGDVENTARSRVQVDSTADGVTYTATYSLTGWRPGLLPLPQVAIPLSGGSSATVSATLPPLQIASVLPADTTGVEPRPPHDVWGASRIWWPWILAALLFLVAVAALLWWLRARRANQPLAPAAPLESPRERVLRELVELEQRRWIERGEWKRYYSGLTGILRTYLASIDADWSPNLTTHELAAVLGSTRDRIMPILRVFERADLVKFARASVTAADARADLQQAREWAQTFEAPVLEVAA